MGQKWKFMLVLLALNATAFAQEVTLPTGVIKPQFFDKQGIKVLSYQKGSSALNIWVVQKGSTKTVFYTTPDNKVLVSGVLWDASSGANISDAYIPTEVVESVAPAAAPVRGNYSHDKVSDAIVNVSKLVGIKEGSAAVDKTLYIIFDPRCPHCDAVYKNTRDFVKRGGSIKWIPSTVLADPSGGARLVAAILEAKNPVTALAMHMGKQTGGIDVPQPSTINAIQANEAYFFAAFDQNKNAGQAGVPVAFFEKQNGEPQMVASIDDDQLLPRILRDIKH